MTKEKNNDSVNNNIGAIIGALAVIIAAIIAGLFLIQNTKLQNNLSKQEKSDQPKEQLENTNDTAVQQQDADIIQETQSKIMSTNNTHSVTPTVDSLNSSIKVEIAIEEDTTIVKDSLESSHSPISFTVRLVIKPSLKGADVLVDGKKAEIIHRTYNFIDIKVASKKDAHTFLLKTDKYNCPFEEKIKSDNQTINILCG